MLYVRDIWLPVQSVLGTCVESEIYAKLNEAVELLRTAGRWDPNEGTMDVCTQETELTLPMDVEMPLAINLGGTPADFRNKWFEFNQSGPGSEQCGGSLTFNWSDKGFFPTFRTPLYASTVAAVADSVTDVAAQIRIYGYDQNDKWIMTADSTGTLVDGFLLTCNGVPSTIVVSRFVRVSKPLTHNFIRMTAYNSHEPTGVLLGYYLPGELEPQYRRIRLSGAGCSRLCNTGNSASSSTCSTSTWVRMRFRKKAGIINSQDDQIFLNSVTALKLACMAIKQYEANLLKEYADYMALAVDALQKTQKAISGPNQMKIQFQGMGYASNIGANMI